MSKSQLTFVEETDRPVRPPWLNEMLPRWLLNLLDGMHFSKCEEHLEEKNERNVYCVDHASVLCQFCMESHANCRMIQIRRYVLHDCVRVKDIGLLMNIDGVQSYTNNGEKAVLLNKKEQINPPPDGHVCEVCDRTRLKGLWLYCSVGCKLHAIALAGAKAAVTALMKDCDRLPSFKIRTSSPTTTKRIPNDPSATTKNKSMIKAKTKNKNKPKLVVCTDTGGQDTSGGATDGEVNDSEVEDPLNSSRGSKPSGPEGPPTPPSIDETNQFPTRKMRSRRTPATRFHPFLPPAPARPSLETEPSFEWLGATRIPSPPPSPSPSSSSPCTVTGRHRRKGVPERAAMW